MKTVGTKAEVYRGEAKHTAGGLKKQDLMKNKRGTVVSKAQHMNGMRMWKKNKDEMVGGLVQKVACKKSGGDELMKAVMSPRKYGKMSPKKSPRKSPKKSPKYSLYKKK
jgi:hypothetical protein